MYGILPDSTLRETNKYSNYEKKFNTRRETHKLLIIIHNISKEKARFKRQKEKKLENNGGGGKRMYGYRLVA